MVLFLVIIIIFVFSYYYYFFLYLNKLSCDNILVVFLSSFKFLNIFFWIIWELVGLVVIFILFSNCLLVLNSLGSCGSCNLFLVVILGSEEFGSFFFWG